MGTSAVRLFAWIDGRYRFLVLGAALAMLMLSGGGVYLLTVSLKHISLALDWPRSVPSLAYSLQYFGGGIGGIMLGHLMDRRGAAAPAMIGATAIGTGAILVHWVSEPWHLYAIYGILFGVLGQGALFSPLIATVIRWFEHRRGLAVGLVTSGQTLSGAFWPPVLWFFIERIEWRDTYLFYGLAMLVLLLPLSLVFRRRFPATGHAPVTPLPADGPVPPPAMASSPPASAAAVAAKPVLPMHPEMLQGTLCVAIVLCCVAMSLPLAHMVAFASDLGHEMADAARLLSVVFVASTFGRIVVLGPLTDRFGGLRSLFLFSSIQALALAMFMIVEGLPGLYILAFCFGLGYSGVTPCYTVAIREHLPVHQLGRRTGMMVLFGGIGMAIGGWLGGFVFDHAGDYHTAFFIGVVSNLANLLIIGSLIYRMRGRSPVSATA